MSEAEQLRTLNEFQREDTRQHSKNMKEKKAEIDALTKMLSDRAKKIEEAIVAIVEKDRLFAQLRKHLREEVELEDEEDGTR